MYSCARRKLSLVGQLGDVAKLPDTVVRDLVEGDEQL